MLLDWSILLRRKWRQSLTMAVCSFSCMQYTMYKEGSMVFTSTSQSSYQGSAAPDNSRPPEWNGPRVPGSILLAFLWWRTRKEGSEAWSGKTYYSTRIRDNLFAVSEICPRYITTFKPAYTRSTTSLPEKQYSKWQLNVKECVISSHLLPHHERKGIVYYRYCSLLYQGG
jgi:hypothetical protein